MEDGGWIFPFAIFILQFSICNFQSSILHLPSTIFHLPSSIPLSSSHPSVLYYERFFGVGRTVAGADNLRFDLRNEVLYLREPGREESPNTAGQRTG